jgi:hypothetical protein
MALPAPAAVRRQLGYLLVALSLGNLFFLTRWYDLELLKMSAFDYFRAGAPGGNVLLQATVLAALILAAGFRIAWWWVELRPTRFRVTLAHCSFLLTLVYPLEGMRRYWNGQNPGSESRVNAGVWALEFLLIMSVILRLRGSRGPVAAARTITVFLAIVTLPLAADFDRDDAPQAAFADQPPAAMLPEAPPGPRFLWVMFDEFDQRLAFEARPVGLELPELDRLKAEAVEGFATQAGKDTIVSVPALLSGQPLSHAEPVDASTLLVAKPESQGKHSWREQPNVFARARAAGVNSELAGWYHPYCRVFGDQLARCLAVPTEQTPALQLEVYSARRGVWGMVQFLLGMQWARLAGMLRGEPNAGWLRARDAILPGRQQQQYFRIRNRAYASAADPRIGLAFYHFPTPHLFPIYDRRAGGFNLRPGLDYLDNLALVDRTVGELRRVLERAGLWRRTSLLITSDHALRPDLWRGRSGWSREMERLTLGVQSSKVPYILKLAGDREHVRMDWGFPAEVTAELALAVLSGEIATHRQAAAWLGGKTSKTGRPNLTRHQPVVLE